MATRALAVCNHLSVDTLFSRLQTGFRAIADHRPGTPKIPLPDALMSAFAMFSLKSPSLLAFDDERKEGNLQQVYGIGQVPCDARMQEILDPVEPESPRPLFKSVFGALQRGKALEEMVFIDGYYLLALDGTVCHSSQEVHRDSCLECHHRNGTVTYSHQMLGAALLHPDRREVIPLMPEPILSKMAPRKLGVCSKSPKVADAVIETWTSPRIPLMATGLSEQRPERGVRRLVS